jgi:hypothetical protein
MSRVQIAAASAGKRVERFQPQGVASPHDLFFPPSASAFCALVRETRVRRLMDAAELGAASGLPWVQRNVVAFFFFFFFFFFCSVETRADFPPLILFSAPRKKKLWISSQLYSIYM